MIGTAVSRIIIHVKFDPPALFQEIQAIAIENMSQIETYFDTTQHFRLPIYIKL